METEAPGPRAKARALPGGSSPIPEQHQQDYTELPVTGWQAVPGRCQPSAPLPSFGITFLHKCLPGKLL